MQQKITFQLLPSETASADILKEKIAKAAGKKVEALTGFDIIKRSIDARKKIVLINLSVNAFFNEPYHASQKAAFAFREVKNASKRVAIIGAGPAGLFAALKLIEAGIKPVILERGKDVRSRRRDLALLNKEGFINPESNYCFGEGGAGTYSDGKLYTRSNKRGNIDRILQLFIHFGADDSIAYDAHPHIGTNKLPHIITAIRKTIVGYGGEFLFEKKMVDLVIDSDKVVALKTGDGDTIKADAYILATGHSARDVFELLHQKKILIEAKPFALGVRVEHPQSLIDSIQYHCAVRHENLPPASYSLVEQVNNYGVFSFCMCPGGIIAPASTAPGELVVNGWSPSKRNNPFANSGMVVQVGEAEAYNYLKGTGIEANDPLLFMKFQQRVEQDAYKMGGGKFVAPAQRLNDFINKKVSANLPANSYLPGLKSTNLDKVLPPYINNVLQHGFRAFGKKLKGYQTNEAIVVATESRTSSPVRIPRNENYSHMQIINLYPCGEGAGYAGGIVSAAMDGEKVADAIAQMI